MCRKLIAVSFVVVVGLIAIGCDPPPTCDANLTHLTTVGANAGTNVFKQLIGDNPTIADNSSDIITAQCNLMAGDKGFNEQPICDQSGWAPGVYYTNSGQSRNQYVRLHLDGNPSYGGVTQMGPIRWRSCITGGSAGDGPAVVVDTVDACQYEFWMLNKNAGIADPECGWGGGLPNDDANQIWDDYEGLGSAASAASVYSSCIWPDEVSTSFNHGFMFGAPWAGNEAGKSVYPFNHADGSGTNPVTDLQGGRRVQLNPSVDISALPTHQKSVCQAMKDYGMINGNSGGLNWGVYSVANRGYTNNPWTGILPDPAVEYWECGAYVRDFRVLAKTAYTSCVFQRGNNSCCMYYGGDAKGTPPSITSISPTSGGSGTTVSLTGTNLSNPISDTSAEPFPGAVRFDNTQATNVTAVSSTLVTCTVPSGSGTVKVSYRTTNGASNLIGFTYSAGPAPTLSSLSPNSGTTAGGTAVTLTGTNMTGTSSVSFGGTAATNVVCDSATKVRCTSPAHAAGGVSVTATNGNGTSNGVTYTYNAPTPTLSAINPTSGTINGGTACTLTGTGLTGCTAVSFGGTAATNVTVVNDTTVTCTSPAKSAGTYSVTATTGGGTSNGVNFIYVVGAPTLSAINPTSGVAAGGTSCTLTGTALTGCTGVSFGGTAATNVTVVNDTTVTCTSPAGSGAVSVTATTGSGTSNGVSFTYIAVPTLSAISPGSGSTSGGTACTLTGTALTGCSAVSFGGTAATGIVVDSSTQVRCVSPAQSAGTVSVTATTPGGTSNGVNYVYTAGGSSYTTTLYSPHDSYVYSASTNKNYGTTNMVVQKNASVEATAYIKFDMNSLSGTTINSAKLRLAQCSSGAATTEKIYSCATDTWLETTIKWSNKPAWGTQQASFLTPGAVNTWVEIDLTSYISANFSGDKLVTIVVRDDANLNQNRQFYSDETGASGGYRPMLVVISS